MMLLSQTREDYERGIRQFESEESLREKWNMSEYRPHWLYKYVHNITRRTANCKNLTNVYNLENPEYEQGVIMLALYHLFWIIPILLVLMGAYWCKNCCRAPKERLGRVLRICICICLTSIALAALIQIFLYMLLTRMPPNITMNARDNDEIKELSKNLSTAMEKAHAILNREYNGSQYKVDHYGAVISEIRGIPENTHTIFEELYDKDVPSNNTRITTRLTTKLLENAWDYLKILFSLWIMAFICILAACIAFCCRPYFLGAFCGIIWCGFSAMLVTWVTVQFADACVDPKNAIKSVPYDWTYREMRSILEEYERVCREFEHMFLDSFRRYRDRYEVVQQNISKRNKSASETTRVFLNAMYKQVDEAANELMKHNLTLDCQYNSSSVNNHFPSHLPPYDRVIRYICEGARKLQLLILQIIILMLAPIICLFILICAIVKLRAAVCRTFPCPPPKTGCSTVKYSSITSCEPCVLPVALPCSFTKRCGGNASCAQTNSCSVPLPIKQTCQIVNPICNPVNIACAYQPFSTKCRKLSFSNPVSSSQICSGTGSNYCPALLEYTRKNCTRRDKSCDAIFKSEPTMVYNTNLDCSTSFSHTRLKLYPALISESKFNWSPTRFLESKATICPSPITQSKQHLGNLRPLESKSTLFPSPISGSEHLILNASISGSYSFLPNFTKSRQETAIQSDTEFKNAILSSIPQIKNSLCEEKAVKIDNLNAIVPYAHNNLNQKYFEDNSNSKSIFSTASSRHSSFTENILEPEFLSYPMPPAASHHSNLMDSDITNISEPEFLSYPMPPAASHHSNWMDSDITNISEPEFLSYPTPHAASHHSNWMDSDITNISELEFLSYPTPPAASHHSNWMGGEITNTKVCPFSANVSQSGDSDQVMSISKSSIYIFPNRGPQINETTEIFEHKQTFCPSSTTLVTDECESDGSKFTVPSSIEELKESFPFIIHSIKSEPIPQPQYTKKQTRILNSNHFPCQHQFCSQCGSHIQSDLEAEEYLYFPPNNTSFGYVPKTSFSNEYQRRDDIVRNRSKRNIKLHQSDSIFKFNEDFNISRPIPGLGISHDSESKSNVSSLPLPVSERCHCPIHSPAVVLKPAIKLPSKTSAEYSKLTPSVSPSQQSLCSGCKSNTDCGSKVHLCVSPRSTSKVRICLKPNAVPVVPIEPSPFTKMTLCGNPKCTSGQRCVCKKKLFYTPTSGMPRKSILVKYNTPRRQLTPYQLANLSSDIKTPLPSILKKPQQKVGSSTKEGNRAQNDEASKIQFNS